MGFFKNRNDTQGYDDGDWGEPISATPIEDITEENTSEDTYAPETERNDYPVTDINTKASLELKVAHPEQFSDAQGIAELLLQGRTVVMNTDFVINKDHEKRIEIFLLGVAFAIRGDIRRVAANTLIITPNNATVSDYENVKSKEEAATDAIGADADEDVQFDRI